MLKTFQVDGYAVNKRGNTVGIQYTLTGASPDTAKSTAQLLAQQGGYEHVRITRVQEVAA
ncbi:TPA: hypothetical protein L9L01_002789 [Klebsiella pneumoniae]|nr:hypothetical protein [Klebsiella pneumoniae]